MKILLLSLLFASSFFLLIDILWLFFSVKSFYRPNLVNLLNDKPIIWAALLFYIVYIFGMALFVLQPAINNDSIVQAFYLGAILGLVAYGTYNLTNMATIKNWSSYVVIVDMVWGAFLTGSSSAFGIYFAKKFLSV